MKGKIYLLLIVFFFSQKLVAQLVEGNDTLYGDEWIKYSQTYFKFPIATDQWYKITYQDLQNAGIPVQSMLGNQIQVFCLGKEVPLFATQSGQLQSNDYFLFYGKQNRGELDAYLYPQKSDQWNPYYSLVTDTAYYFLTWSDNPVALRYQSISNDLINPPPRTEYYIAEKLIFQKSEFIKKPFGDTYLSSFDAGEAYTDGFSQHKTYQFSNIDPYLASGVPAQLSLRYTASANSHQMNVLWDNSNIASEDFYGFAAKSLSKSLSLSEVQGQHNLMINGELNEFDRFALSYAKLDFPRSFDAQGLGRFEFSLEGSGKKYIEVANFASGTGAIFLFDLDNLHRIESNLENGLVKLGFNSNFPETNYQLVAESQIQNIPPLLPLSFVNYADAAHDFIIISNPKLQAESQIQDYAQYRQSASGGNYQTLIVDVNQLYDQYSYGIQRHFQALRNFSQLLNNKQLSPKGIFIIGKGREFPYVRNPQQLSSPDNNSFFVPTYGYPGSDNLLVSDLSSGRPNIALGRIAVSKPSDVALYLQKVKDFDSNQQLPQSIEDKAWMKEIIHLGGGGSTSEQSIIKSNLSELQTIAENNRFGAHVNNLFKTTSDPIQIPDSKRLFEWISNGVSVMTFFGHSGVGGFDIALDAPSKYNNYKKYPLVISLGCYVGQIHTPQVSFSEGFVLAPDRGGIAMWASTSEAYISSLQSTSRQFYQNFGGSNYGSTIGEQIKNTLNQIPINQFGVRELIHQITYHGDPMLVLNASPGADYIPDPASVRINPASPDAQQDTFQVAFNIKNIGQNLHDSIVVELKRVFPDESVTSVYKQKVPAPKNTLEYVVQLPVLGNRSIGKNRILIEVDPDGLAEELPAPAAKMNNRLSLSLGEEGIPFFVVANGIRPVEPAEFSIQSSPPVLRASTTDVFAPIQTYIFQLDSLATFDSGLKQSSKISQVGGLVNWTPSINLESGKVYYWRVCLDTIPGKSPDWHSSSFLYQEAANAGWNQSHFGQLASGRFSNLEQNVTDHKLKFEDDLKSISILNGVYPSTWPALTVNNDVYVYLPWDDPILGGIYVAVFDSSTAQPWINIPPGDYGSHVSPWAYWAAFPYWTNTPEARQQAINFLENVIPPKSYVLVYTVQHPTEDYRPEDWASDSVQLGTNLFQVFEKQGGFQLRSTATEGAKPYVFLYRKDDPSFPIFEKLVEKDQQIEEKLNIFGSWYIGNIESSTIGPAVSWDELHWKVSGADANDQYNVDILGVNKDKSTDLLGQIASADTNIQYIDANQYPYLKLRFNAKDSVTRTAPNLDFWRIQFQAVSEIALDPNDQSLFYKDTIQQGDTMRLAMNYRNLGSYPADSLFVQYSISDANNQSILGQVPLNVIEPGQVQTFQIKHSTRNLSGPQILQFDLKNKANKPDPLPFNNNGIKPFLVQKDQRNPYLDVTFDGRKIIDGDLVSAEPEIVIFVRDENRYLGLTDTSQFKLVLRNPDQSVLEIASNDPRIQFIPADTTLLDKKNEARLIYKPKLDMDGEYQLLVQSADATGNAAGSQDYKIHFKVINESLISNLVNYPNPFSTSTRFVYTLSGAMPPSSYSIQIFTVSGKLIKVLTQNDLGPLRIGTNMTDFAWNGKDQYGDQLANGVYLYRLRVKDESGKSLERYEIKSIDPMSKKGFSKMVILR
ncbi:MAG: C25 family cysteine peptidase [Saprospiraceae bacterium]